jgi:hypothetical protein
VFSNKNGCARIEKLVKTLMEFLQKFSILTENLVDFDVTCSVILGTVPLRTTSLVGKYVVKKWYVFFFPYSAVTLSLG